MPKLQLYNPGFVSEITSIPPSTLRRMSNKYSEYLSEYATRKGTRRKYTDLDIIILVGFREGHPPDVVPDPPSAITMLPAINQAFEDLRAQIAQQSAQLNEQSAQLTDMQERLNAIEAERNLPWYKRFFGGKG